MGKLRLRQVKVIQLISDGGRIQTLVGLMMPAPTWGFPTLHFLAEICKESLLDLAPNLWDPELLAVGLGSPLF